MTVVYKGPGCAPEVREIGNTLRDFQTRVGGDIIVAGIDGDEFASLGPEEISTIIRWFGYAPDGREAGENAKNEN